MNIHHLYDIIEHSTSIQDISSIQKVCDEYPYFSIPQMLYISYLYQNNDDEFSRILKKFSHNIPNRKYFFHHLKKTSRASSHTPSSIQFVTSTPTSYNTPTNNIPTKTDTSLSLSNETSIPQPPSTEQTVSQSTSSTNSDNTIITTSSSTNTSNTNFTSQNISSTDIQNEVNKSIAESIVQKEILDIYPQIKSKAEEIATTNTTSTNTSDNKDNNDPIAIQENIDTQNTGNLSLSYWLKKFSHKKENQHSDLHISTTSTTHITPKDKKQKIKEQQAIIDKIIANPPKTIKPTSSHQFYSAENKAKESLLETEDLVSETLAQIYAAQGNIHKAIRAYEILALKFPHKNTYFAAKIEELKQQLKK